MILLSLEATVDELGLLSTTKPVCGILQLSQDSVLHKNVFVGSGNYPTGFCCGSEHIIMATHTPAPQSVTVGTKSPH